ncbi:MAG TPA: hypothetical protein DCZ00_01120 [Lactococcus sp.]|uniref:hypothetical protein n=1 Tax=Lactococcus muris TaxID=2941330 RepID=UPI000E9814C1|nr:hypothetical protein [Lactococcus muris]HBC90029.1 hypothetical protein [Lactococcus sp.]
MRKFLKEGKKEIQDCLLLEKLKFKQMVKNRQFWQIQLLNVLKIMMTLSFWGSILFAFRSFVGLFFIQKAWPGLQTVEGREQALSSIFVIFFFIVVFRFSYALFKGLDIMENTWRFMKHNFIIWSLSFSLMGLKTESVEGIVGDVSQSFQINLVALLLGFSFFAVRQIIQSMIFRKLDQLNIFEKWIPMIRWYGVETRNRQTACNTLNEGKTFQTGFESSTLKIIRFKFKYSRIEMVRILYPEAQAVYWVEADIPSEEPKALDFSDYPFSQDGEKTIENEGRKGQANGD